MAFKKGESGNPKGRAKGSENFYTKCIKEAQKKNEPQLLELFYKKAVELAEQNDDLSGLALIYKSTEKYRNHVLPIALTGSLQDQIKTIQNALAEGQITPSETLNLMTSIEKQAKIIETIELKNKVDFLWNERNGTIEQSLDAF